MSRKLYLASLLTEAVRIVKEAQQPPAAPPAPPAGTQAVPASPVPPSPATNAQGPSGADPNAPPPAGGEQPKPFDLDVLIDRLNVIRGGKSFADPEVYGQLTTYFNGLNDTDKAVIDRFLQSIGKIVIQVDNNQNSGSNTAQPPMNQTPAAPPAPAASAAPMQEALEPFREDVILESVKEGVRFRFGNKEMDFGSSDHLKVLKYMLHGLQNLRDCYQVGSANRHVYASACHKLRKLIAKHGSVN